MAGSSSIDQTLTGTIVQRIDEATEKGLVPLLVFTLETTDLSDLDKHSWTGFLKGERHDCKYNGCIHESFCFVTIQILEMLRYRSCSQCNILKSGIEQVSKYVSK